MIKEVRTLPEYYGPIQNGLLTFIVRPDDVTYNVGDILRLREWDTPGTHFSNLSDDGYTGRHIDVRVTYVMDPGRCRCEADLVKDGHVILAIKRTGGPSRMKIRNGYLDSISRWMDDILERRRMDREIERAYTEHIDAHAAIGRLAVELSSAADDVPGLTISERAAIRRAACELSDVLKGVMDREERLRKAVYEGGSYEDRPSDL